MILDNNRLDIAEEYGLLPFDLRVLEPARTICEKIMSLVRFSYSENPLENLKKKIRHTYDLHQLLQQKEFKEFFSSPAFDEMLLKVAKDDLVSFKNNNQWLKNHPTEALIFKNLEKVWLDLKIVYKADFKDLVFGNFPKDELVLQTLIEIRNRMMSIKWQLVIN
jgi:hypothetical protein